MRFLVFVDSRAARKKHERSARRALGGVPYGRLRSAERVHDLQKPCLSNS